MLCKVTFFENAPEKTMYLLAVHAPSLCDLLKHLIYTTVDVPK